MLEFGRAFIDITQESPLFDNFTRKTSQVWMSHGDKVTKIPEDFQVIAKTENAPFAAIANEDKKIYGVQFHPEVIHSIEGKKLLENFVVKIAKSSQDWNMGDLKNEQIRLIKEKSWI